MMRDLQMTFKARDIAPNVFAGIISGLMTVIASISYATLIFAGSFGSNLSLGISAALISASVIGAFVALRSSSPFVIAGPDANISAILSLIIAPMAAAAVTSSAAPFSTIWAAIVLCSFLTGIFLYLVGTHHLGRWIRFIPYPVVGGFLAGTGWLLVSGSFKVMADLPLTSENLLALIQFSQLIHWMPGLIFALLLVAILRRTNHFLVMPGLILIAIVVFHGWIYSLGLTVGQATLQGWLLSPLPQDLVLKTARTLSFSEIDWTWLARQPANVGALMIVAAIVILLNSASVEIATRSDIDLDSELKSTGLANLLAAPAGGLVGCIALSRTLLNWKAGATARLSGMAAAAVSASVLLFGTSLLTYLPKPVLGGLLLSLGLNLLIEWVYDGWYKFPRFDYFLVLAIVLIIALWGFLPGVGIGLVVACILFAFNYSRINVIKYELTGTAYRSNVERSWQEQEILKERGAAVHILRLQGYIFFGTAYPLLDHIQKYIKSTGPKAVRFVLLDFSFVSGIDSSSVLIFNKMKQICEENNVTLVFVHVREKIRQLLAEGGCLEETAERTGQDVCRLFADLDYAVGFCEDEILRQEKATAELHPSLEDHFSRLFRGRDSMAHLRKYLEKLEEPAGYVLFRQGEPAEDLYFVESGAVTALLELPNGKHSRLRTMGAGTIVGEMGLYLNTPRSATVITDEPSVLYRLSAEAMEKLKVEEPELASDIHEFIARLLANRLSHANEVLAHLLS